MPSTLAQGVIPEVVARPHRHPGGARSTQSPPRRRRSTNEHMGRFRIPTYAPSAPSRSPSTHDAPKMHGELSRPCPRHPSHEHHEQACQYQHHHTATRTHDRPNELRKPTSTSATPSNQIPVRHLFFVCLSVCHREVIFISPIA